jgi:hypothetical protein
MRQAVKQSGVRLWAAAAACLLLAGGAARADDQPAGKPPRLEFRTLANGKDDADAFEAAAKLLADPGRKDELQKLAEAGKPPPAPEAAAGKGPGYAWAEVGPAMLRDDGKEFAKSAAKARDAAGPVPSAGGSLLYARPCRDKNLSKEGREAKKYDYFLLSRLPEKGKAVTGDVVVEAKGAKDDEGRLCLDFSLSPEGGELMRALTSQNQERPLGVLIDGRVAAAPVVRALIATKVHVSGDFAPEEIDALVEALRAGIPTKDK